MASVTLSGRVARQVFLQRVANQAAPRPIGTPSKAFRALEDVIGDGHGRFHTLSITAGKDQAMVRGRDQVRPANCEGRGRWLSSFRGSFRRNSS